MVVTVPATVAGSISTAGRGEKPEPDLLSREVRKPDLIAGVIDSREIRRHIALFYHSFLLLFGPSGPVRVVIAAAKDTCNIGYLDYINPG